MRILELGDALLGRDGEIVVAAAAVYRRVMESDPAFVTAIIDAGYVREIITALASGA